MFESHVRKEFPFWVGTADRNQVVLFPAREIITNNQRAERVYTALVRKGGSSAKKMLLAGFLSDSDDRELILLKFIALCLEKGRNTAATLTDSIVMETHHMVRAVQNEAHQYLGFVRFSEHDGCLFSIIEPKHAILPLIRSHFCSRYPEERFMIYDQTHGEGLAYEPYRSIILPLTRSDLPEDTENEVFFRELWSAYYHSISIPERESEKRLFRRMPKRIRSHLVELRNWDINDPIIQVDPMPGKKELNSGE